eukprot:139234_1
MMYRNMLYQVKFNRNFSQASSLNINGQSMVLKDEWNGNINQQSMCTISKLIHVGSYGIIITFIIAFIIINYLILALVCLQQIKLVHIGLQTSNSKEKITTLLCNIFLLYETCILEDYTGPSVVN